MGVAIAKKLKISPVAPILAIAVSSNLQGAATLVGDTTSILLAGHLGLDFMDFFAYEGRPGMFWVVEVGALVTVPVMLFLFREEKGKLYGAELTPVTDYLPTFLLLGTVGSLIAASFVPEKPDITNGVICMAFFLVGLALEAGRGKLTANLAADVLKAIDYETLALLAGLFVVIHGIERVGIIDDISRIITGLGGGSLFLTYTIIVWASVIISAFVDNIPYTATMLPVMSGVAASLGVNQAVLCFGLRTDFLTHFFPGARRLMELADSITEIKTVCACGRKATVNARIDGNGRVITEGGQILLGGNDSYVAMCHKCWIRNIREHRKVKNR